MKKLIIHSQEFLRFVSNSDISHCKSDNCYISVFLNGGEELVLCKSLKKLTGELSSNIFIRVSQSYVVNKNYIKLVNKKQKLIELADGKKIPFTTIISDLIEMMGVGASVS